MYQEDEQEIFSRFGQEVGTEIVELINKECYRVHKTLAAHDARVIQDLKESNQDLKDKLDVCVRVNVELQVLIAKLKGLVS